MTEQEAINILNGIDEVHGNLPEDGNDVEIALMMARDTLEEVRRYRALGIVEELQEAMEKQVGKKMKDRCPDCGTPIKKCYFNCPGCGQAIDWSERK